MIEADKRVKIVSKLGSGLDLLLRLLATLAGLLVIFMMLSITYEVVLRYYFSRSLVWVTPFTEYSLVLLTFLGAPLLLRRNQHVNLEIVVSRLAPRTQTFLTIITSILGALACLIIACFGTYTTWDLYHRNVMVTEAVEIPESLIVAVIPLATFFLFIEFLNIARRNILHLSEASDKK